MHIWLKEKGEGMTHQRRPLIWTVVIHALYTTCLTKIAKELYQNQPLGRARDVL